MSIASQSARDAQLGAAVLRRFANAVATFAGGEQVEGLFERTADSPTLGGLSVRSRSISFDAITAELPPSTTDGAPLSVAMGDTPTVPVGQYRIARGGRIDDLEERTTRLLLELA